MILYNARDKNYKSVLGALATEQSVLLRLLVPRSMSCCGARLVITKEQETPVSYSMFWAGMNTEDDEWWEMHFSATTAGLYWYKFELDTPWGISQIVDSGNGIGSLDSQDTAFQLSVYNKEFVTPDWLKGGLIYQIFPDRFFNSGTSKLGVPSDRILREDWGGEPYWRPDENGIMHNNDFFCGDLKGIEQKLPYIASMGVTCIYLNPIFESHSNHRYDTADYLVIDPLLGNEADLSRLCAQAKKKGIAIVLDGVFSHTGCDSRYFNRNLRYDTLGAYNSKDSPYYSWYKFIEWPQKYQSWWGIELLPELIESNEAFQSFLFAAKGVIAHWLGCGVSGWRLDVADELPDSFLDQLRIAVKKENRDAIIIGEVWEDATTKFAYGQRRRYLMGGQLDSVMNYPFANAIVSFVRNGNGHQFMECIMKIVEHYPPQVLAVVMNHIGTHDTERAITKLAGKPSDGHDREWQSKQSLTKDQYEVGVARLKLASFIQYMLPGVPSLYYGDEAGMEGYRDPFNRVAYPWGHENRSLHQWYQRLGQIRHSCKSLVDGMFEPLVNEQHVIAFCRHGETNSILVAVNQGTTPVSVPVPPEWSSAYNIVGNLPTAGMLQLEPLSCVLLSK